MQLAVVTRAPNDSGNWASVVPENINEISGNALDITVFFKARTRVFKPGEILVLDANDRDQFSRKPSKWDVDLEWVETIEQAMEVVARVKEE